MNKLNIFDQIYKNESKIDLNTKLAIIVSQVFVVYKCLMQMCKLYIFIFIETSQKLSVSHMKIVCLFIV